MAGHANGQNSADEDLKLKNINYLKKCYKKYIRNDFLESFEALYCKSSMNDPFLNKILKTNCNHPDTNKEINFKHYELMMYVKNIVDWLDPKMDHYDDDPTTRSISKHTSFKTCSNQDEEHISRICSQDKCVETLEKNEFPHVTYLKHQTNYSSKTDTKIRFHKVPKDLVVDNSLDNTIFTKLQIKNVDSDDNANNNIEESLINNTAEESIDPDDNPQNNNESLNSNPEEDINKIFKNMVNNISCIMETSMENINSDDISINTIKENINTSLIINDIKETTSMSKSLKNNITPIIEEKLNLVQSTCDNGKNENTLERLETSTSKIDKQHSNYANELSTYIKLKLNKRSKKTLNNSSTRKKRCNPAIKDTEYISKKKKIENLSVSHAVQNNHDERNSVKTLNDPTKKADKKMYNRNSKGETKLHAACTKGKLDLVTELLVNGFNPNVKDNAGWAPLHEAVKNGHCLIVKKLIDYGAYLNVPGFEYESPLFTAIKYDQFDIALTLFQNGADLKCINMYGTDARSLNGEKYSQLIKSQIPCVPSGTKYVYESEQIIIFMYKVSLQNAIKEQFFKQFNIKSVQNLLSEKEHKRVTHIVLPETENNTCDINMDILIGIANGLFIVNQKWISDSLKQKKLLSCENYEVNGTTTFVDSNGPKTSRISKQNLCPKLFDGICIYVSGNIGWESFSLEQLKKLVLAFGAKLLTRMPNPEDCPTNIIPYHCRNNKEMYYVSTIILYTIDSNRLIKYNMKHLKTFPISWFIKVVQEYTIT